MHVVRHPGATSLIRSFSASHLPGIGGVVCGRGGGVNGGVIVGGYGVGVGVLGLALILTGQFIPPKPVNST